MHNDARIHTHTHTVNIHGALAYAHRHQHQHWSHTWNHSSLSHTHTQKFNEWDNRATTKSRNSRHKHSCPTFRRAKQKAFSSFLGSVACVQRAKQRLRKEAVSALMPGFLLSRAAMMSSIRASSVTCATDMGIFLGPVERNHLVLISMASQDACWTTWDNADGCSIHTATEESSSTTNK